MRNFKPCFYLLFLGICLLNISCEKDSLNSQSDLINQEEISYQYSEIELEVFDLLNEYRASLNLPELRLSNLASSLALDHNYYMINQSQISHDNFNQRAQKLMNERSATSVGENVAYGYVSAQNVMEGWLNSPGHKANIESDYSDIGISVKKSPSGRNYFGQLFYKK